MMGNQNQRYRTGLEKRAAIEAAVARLERAGAFESEPEKDTVARLGFRPQVLLDTNIAFSLGEYWTGEQLCAALRTLRAARPALALYLPDAVLSEIRGQGKKSRRARFGSMVLGDGDREAATAMPLATSTRAIAELDTRLRNEIMARRGGLLRPSDGKDSLIAATALAYDMVLLTANPGDFRVLDGRPRGTSLGLRLLVIEKEGNEHRFGSLVLERIGALVLEGAGVLDEA